MTDRPTAILLFGLVAGCGAPPPAQSRDPATQHKGGTTIRFTSGNLKGAVVEFGYLLADEHPQVTVEQAPDLQLAGYVPVGPALRISPKGLPYEDFTITLPIDPGKLPSSRVDHALVVLEITEWLSSPHRDFPSSIDRQAGTLQTVTVLTGTYQAGARVCPEDGLEENDTRGAAKALASLPVRQQKLASCGGDADWYRIDLGAGAGLTATVTSGREAVLDEVLLVDTSGGALTHRRTHTHTYEERDVHLYYLAGAASETVLLKALYTPTGSATDPYREAADAPYVLSAAVASPLPGVMPPAPFCADDDSEEDDTPAAAGGLITGQSRWYDVGWKYERIACPADADWYQVPLPGDKEVTFRVTWPAGEGELLVTAQPGSGVECTGLRGVHGPATGPSGALEVACSNPGPTPGTGTASEVRFGVESWDRADDGPLGVPYHVTAERRDVYHPPPGRTIAASVPMIPSSGHYGSGCGAPPAAVAGDDAATTDEDVAVTIDILANDVALDWGPLKLALSSWYTPFLGTAAIRNDKLVYTPNPNRSGTETIRYTVEPSQGCKAEAEVTVTVNAVVDLPVAAADSASTDEDHAVSIPVLHNDTAGDGMRMRVLTAAVVSSPANGTAVAEGFGDINYTPNADFAGSDHFEYEATNREGGTARARVDVTVRPVNDPPVAVQDHVRLAEDGDTTIAVLANDRDVDALALELVVAGVTQPPRGRASVTVDSGGVHFRPDADEHGTFTFQYTVEDSHGGTDTGTVQAVVAPVNDVPVANDDRADAQIERWVEVFVLANDVDPDNEPLTVRIESGPTHGSTSVTAGNTVIYRPARGAAATDSLVYRLTDGAGTSDTATVRFTIRDSNRPPVAADDAAQTDEDTPVVIQVLANDSDPDLDSIFVDNVSQPGDGTTSLLPGGDVRYVPDAEFSGQDAFDYRMTDRHGGTDTATVAVTVLFVNDPPTAVDDTLRTSQDTPAEVDPLANDSDLENDPMTLDGVGMPSHGGAVINLWRRVDYTPHAGWHGTDSFSYQVSDHRGAASTGTVRVTVTPAGGPGNGPPVATDDGVVTDEDTPLLVDVLANDSDPDGDPLGIPLVAAPGHGRASVQPGPVVRYEPDQDFSGQDSFDYTVSDGQGHTDTATLTVTVRPINDPPVAVDDAFAVRQGEELVVAPENGVLANDRDVEGTPLGVDIVEPTAHGPLALDPDGGFVYLPDPGFVGEDVFEYVADDGEDTSAPATARIEVRPAQAGLAYTLVRVGPMGGGQITEARAVNVHGDVAGSALTGEGLTRPFRYGPDPDGGPDPVMLDLGTLGGTDGEGWGINDAGHVTGNALTAAWEAHAFLWDGAGMADLGTLGGPMSLAYALNDTGQVVGESSAANDENHAFVWEAGVLTDLGTLGGELSVAWDVNAHGQVVGESLDAQGMMRGFLWVDDVMRDVGDLGGGMASAYGINDAGQIVGVSEREDGSFSAFLRPPADGGDPDPQPVDLGRLGGFESIARDVNNLGHVVGESDTEAGGELRRAAFVVIDGEMRDLNEVTDLPAGYRLGVAWGINDGGQIVGTTFDNDGMEVSAWRLDPVGR